MPKLPAYVFRRPNGSYRYKKNVPKKLREVVGKGTLYRQLGESYAEAMRKLPKVHAEIEALFQMEQHTPMSERALAVIRGALGDEVADMVVAGHIAEYSQENYALNELAKDHQGEAAYGGGAAGLQWSVGSGTYDTDQGTGGVYPLQERRRGE